MSKSTANPRKVIEDWGDKPHSQMRDMMLRQAFKHLGWHYTSKARCAARFIELTGCTTRTAADAFGLYHSTVDQVMIADRKRAGRRARWAALTSSRGADSPRRR